MKKLSKKKVYSFNESSIKFNVDAQIAGEELDRIKSLHGNSFKPEDVVNEAKKSNNPLHNCFGDWDDVKDAFKHRVQIARLLIGSIKVTFRGYQSTRASYSVKINTVTDEKPSRAYVSVDDAVQPDYELQFKEEALNALKSFVKRYQVFDYLEHEVQVVNKLISKLEIEVIRENAEKEAA